MEVWVFGLAALVILLIVVNIFSLSLNAFVERGCWHDSFFGCSIW